MTYSEPTEFFLRHLKSNDHFMNFIEFNQAYPNSNINFMLFNSVISAVRNYEQKCSITYENKEPLENQTTIQYLIDLKNIIKHTKIIKGK